MKKKLLKYSIWFICLFIGLELSLRIFLDNETRILYESDKKCEYKLVSNQKATRFHNYYETNSYGMRSAPISTTAKKRVLFFGDSVLNGGSKIDQTELVTELLKGRLESNYNYEIDVCNISANSWGPENAFRYLENYIDFQFDLIILVFSSHDFHDNMHFREVVGEQVAWPSDQPYLATTDFFSGYIAPKFTSLFGGNYDYLEGFDDSKINPGWELFVNYAQEKNMNMIVYHHPELEEIQKGEFNKNGNELQELLSQFNTSVLSGISIEKKEEFLDNIHLNESGHKSMANSIYNEIVLKHFLENE